MIDIKKIENGISLFDSEKSESTNFIFQGSFQITQPDIVHVWTDKGVIFLDLTCTIESQTFLDINDFVISLYS